MILATDANRVLPIKIGNAVTHSGIISSVFVLFSGFMLSIVAFTVIVALLGYDFEIAFSSVVACIMHLSLLLSVVLIKTLYVFNLPVNRL